MSSIGRLAELVAYPADPLTVDLDRPAELTPTFTLVGGRPVYDAENRSA
jgi:predicted amidohydrolase YtcJ